MANKNSSVPEIRFKGFTDAWIQRGWAETVDISTNMVDPKTGEYDELPHVGPGNIESFTGQLLSNIKTVKEEKLISGKFHFKSGDIVYGKINPQLAKYILSDFEGLCSADAYVLNAKSELEQCFLFRILQSKQFYDYSVSVSQRTGMPKINRDELNQYNFNTPTKPEQISIGSFFHTLDKLLAASQRKVEGLKRLKAAYLQQMFPQAGEQVPRVRFEGYKGDWEVRQLGELVTQTVREVPKPDKPYKRLSIRSHAKGTFHQFVDEPEKVAMDKLYIVHENDLIVNITFAWEHAIAVADKEDNGLLVSHRFPTFEIDRADIKFIRVLVSQESFRRKMELISPGGAGRNRVLSKGSFVNISLVVPNIKEQITIGNFFRNLDEQIDSQVQKLEQLKHLKAAYLQKMFI